MPFVLPALAAAAVGVTMSGSAGLALPLPKPVRHLAESVTAEAMWRTKLRRENEETMTVGKDVEIRENDMGKGLYALTDLPAFMIVARYRGVLVDADDYAKDTSSGAYAMGLANGKVIDGEVPWRSNFVRYINHSKRKENCAAYDAFDEDAIVAAVYIQTERPIKAGEELFFDYGDEYWDARAPRFSPARLRIDWG